MKTSFPSFKNFIEHNLNKEYPYNVFVCTDNSLWSGLLNSLPIIVSFKVYEVPILHEYDKKIIEVDSLSYLLSLHYDPYDIHVWIAVEKI